MNVFRKVEGLIREMAYLPEKIKKIQEALGRIEQRQVLHHSSEPGSAEFRVFSQWGEDGIIQYLVNHVPIESKVFVEFGVENYTESNTRFLVINNQWSGLVMDGCGENIAFIKQDPIYWGYNIKAEQAFVTKDNINDLILRNGIRGDIGILSVDIDGNDYWVWEAITCISPRIVICEYNSLFGPTAKVTTPYDPAFVRGAAHFSKVYYGASIAALSDLALRKGYSLVAGNSAGNNVFFVRNDLLGSMKVLRPSEAFCPAHFREFHDEEGKLTFDSFEERLAKIQNLELFDLDTNTVKKVKDTVGTQIATQF